MGRRDDEAFTEFVATRSRALQRSAYLLVGERGLAQDLVQEALAKTYVAWPRLRAAHKAEAYTRKVITTTAISWYRRKAWSSERPTDTLPERAGDGHADRVAERELLWSALQLLPPRQRAAIVCRYYDDLTEVQTAAAMGCAPGTVKSQVSAGLTKLRAALAEDGLDSDDFATHLEATR